MGTGVGLAAALDAVDAAFAVVRGVVDGAGWQYSDVDVREGLRRVAQMRCEVEAAYLSVVRELDRRESGRGGPGVAMGRATGGAAEAVVREVVRSSAGAARRDVAAARAIGPDGVPAGFGARLASGVVCREHVDVAVGCLDAIPAHLLVSQADRDAVTDGLAGLVDAGCSVREFRRGVRLILERLDPGGRDRCDPDSARRRFLDMGTDSTGMLVGSFQLDPAAGAIVAAVIGAFSAPVPEGTDAEGRVVRDPRTARQRRADALETLADMALGVTSPRRGERPRIVVHTTVGQLTGDSPMAASTESGQVLPEWAVRRLSCDAVLQRVVVDESLGPVDVGREHRLVTLAQRRALAVRDGGCVICGTEPDWCDAHHVVHWAQGGVSDLANYALLCPRHHTLVHTGEWQVRHATLDDIVANDIVANDITADDITADDDSPGVGFAVGDLVIVAPRHVDPRQRPRPPTRYVVDAVVRRFDHIGTGHMDTGHIGTGHIGTDHVDACQPHLPDEGTG